MKREESFEVGERPELVVVAANSDVLVKGGGPGRIDVVLEGSEAGLDLFDITHAGDLVSIRLRKGGGRRLLTPPVSISVTLPDLSDVDIRTASGDVFGSVETRSLAVASSSGDVRFGACCSRAKVKTASGDVALDEVSGDLECASASGDVTVESVAGDLSVNTASGDLVIGEVSGRIVAKSASGDVRIERFDGPSLEVSSMSGDVVVGLAPGMALDTDVSTVSGDLFNNITPSGDEPTRQSSLRVKTMSGDITLR